MDKFCEASSTTEDAETHPCAARNGLGERDFLHFSRETPHSKCQYMEDGHKSARRPKASFVLHSVSRVCGLL